MVNSHFQMLLVLITNIKNYPEHAVSFSDSILCSLSDGRDQSITLAVTTNDPEAIEAIKDGFRQVFEHVAVHSHSSASGIAPLPVGFSAGAKGAQHRIANLVRGNKVLEGQVIIGVEEMVSELLPGK